MVRLSGILIYCERSGDWAAALRRELRDGAIQQRETRSLAECREVLSLFPASLVVLELTAASADRALEWLAAMGKEFPQACAVAVAERGLEGNEWIAREFGCLAFTTSPRELKPVAELVRRYLASLPRPEMTFEEEIWSRLPWKGRG
jgi:hypothetical protein